MSRITFTAARPSGTQALAVDYSDGSQATYSLMWLLDSCPEGFHPQTGERAFDLLSVPDAPLLHAAQILDDGRLELQWEHAGPASHFAPAWLAAHRPGVPRADAAAVPHRYWKAADLPHGAPRHDASATRRGGWENSTIRSRLMRIHSASTSVKASLIMRHAEYTLRHVAWSSPSGTPVNTRSGST